MRCAMGVLLFLVGYSSLVSAEDHPRIREALTRIAPTAQIDSIRPSALPGLFEVVAGGEVLYLSADGNYLLQGRLFDTRNRVDVTADTEKGLRAVALDKIGPEKRLSFEAKDPKHRITIFTDVDCAYCRKLHQEVAEYNRAGISVDYLFFPRAGLNSASFDKAAFIWCSDDPKQTMNQSMTTAGIAHAPATCAHPINETLALAQRISKSGTPNIFAEDGSFLGGYQTAAELGKRLAALETSAAP